MRREEGGKGKGGKGKGESEKEWNGRGGERAPLWESRAPPLTGGWRRH